MVALPPVLARGLPSGLAYGGDYNPEQFPAEVWVQDAALMREAGVTLVTLGVFSWARIEPTPGAFDVAWLDHVIGLLQDADIAVDLATATASPPAWLLRRHPEVALVDRQGVRQAHGSRQAWCPSSPVYRRYALSLVERLARHYTGHPALALWHVSNELGGHNGMCFCAVSAAAFRAWLQARYETLEGLNSAWGTNFWSQHYGAWEEIEPPRAMPTTGNPAQELDWRRFSSDELLAVFEAERDLLHELSPGVAVTTNFMVMAHRRDLDYHRWAAAQDVVSNDHYLDGRLPDPHVELSFSADWTRGLAGGAPWLLMEHSTSAVSWQPRNFAKAPGQLRRNSLQHVARGADFVGFFQWRASLAGAEKFHSAMLPHAGTDSRVWREVVELGRTLQALGELAGTRVAKAQVALLLDYEAWWGCELDAHPSAELTYLDRAHALYRALWDAGVAVDVVHPSDDLSGYRVAMVPTLYLVSDADAAALTAWVRAGGHALVTYFSGIVDGMDRVRAGGYPGAFRDLLGVRVEEFTPLETDTVVGLTDDTGADAGHAGLWVEDLQLTGAEAMCRYEDGPLPGVAALTRNTVGAGAAWYLATRTDPATTADLVERVLAGAGVRPGLDGHRLPAGVECVRRVDAERSYLFVLNHRREPVDVPADGLDLVTGQPVDASLRLAGGGVACVRERRD